MTDINKDKEIAEEMYKKQVEENKAKLRKDLENLAKEREEKRRVLKEQEKFIIKEIETLKQEPITESSADNEMVVAERRLEENKKELLAIDKLYEQSASQIKKRMDEHIKTVNSEKSKRTQKGEQESWGKLMSKEEKPKAKEEIKAEDREKKLKEIDDRKNKELRDQLKPRELKAREEEKIKLVSSFNIGSATQYEDNMEDELISDKIKKIAEKEKKKWMKRLTKKKVKKAKLPNKKKKRSVSWMELI